MKKLMLLLVFLCFTMVQSYAQADDKLAYFNKAEKFRKMKNAGKGLTIGGGVVTVAGLIVMFSSSTTTYYDGYGSPTTSTEGNPVAGAVAYILGSAAVGAGIPLWVVGKNNERKYKLKFEEYNSSLHLDIRDTGLALTYRF